MSTCSKTLKLRFYIVKGLLFNVNPILVRFWMLYESKVKEQHIKSSELWKTPVNDKIRHKSRNLKYFPLYPSA